MQASDIPFEECLKLKRNNKYPFPAIRVGEGNNLYLSVEACELIKVHHLDQFATAPDPDASGDPHFYICKTTDGRGWTVSRQRAGSELKTGGGGASAAMIKRLGAEFDEARTYEIEKAGMKHPEWGTPIFIGKPHDE